jgi:hypothetical protein
VKARIVKSYEVETISNLRDKRITEDRIFRLTPTEEFIQEMIASNSRHKQNLEKFTDFANTKNIERRVLALDSNERLLHKELMQWSFTSSRALALIDSYPATTLRRILKEVGTGYRAGKIKSPSGFILSALEQGWYSEYEVLIPDQQELIEDPNDDIINTLPPILKVGIMAEWEKWDQSLRGTFNKYGLKSPAIRSALGIED